MINEQSLNVKIEIDGGVTQENAKKLLMPALMYWWQEVQFLKLLIQSQRLPA